MTPFQRRVYENRWKTIATGDVSRSSWASKPEKLSEAIGRATAFSFAAKKFDDLKTVADVGGIILDAPSARAFKLFLPVPYMWLELVTDRLAAILIQDGTPHEYVIFFAHRLPQDDGSMRNSVSFESAIVVDPEEGTINISMAHPQPGTEAAKDMAREELARVLLTLGAIVVINEPTMYAQSTERMAASYAETKRMRRDHPRLGAGVLDVTVVTLHRGAIERYTRDVKRAMRAAVKKCQHDVRAHMRTLKGGRKILVRSHQRGDPALGTKTHDYVVKVEKTNACDA